MVPAIGQIYLFFLPAPYNFTKQIVIQFPEIHVQGNTFTSIELPSYHTDRDRIIESESMAFVAAQGLLIFDMLLCLFWSVFVAPEVFTIVTNKGPGGPPQTEPTASVPCEDQKGWVSHLSV